MKGVWRLTRGSGVLGSMPGLAACFRFSFRFFKKGSCRLLARVCARGTGWPLGRSGPARGGVVGLADRPGVALGVCRGRGAAVRRRQQQHLAVACDVYDGVFLCCSFSHEVSWMRS